MLKWLFYWRLNVCVKFHQFLKSYSLNVMRNLIIKCQNYAQHCILWLYHENYVISFIFRGVGIKWWKWKCYKPSGWQVVVVIDRCLLLGWEEVQYSCCMYKQCVSLHKQVQYVLYYSLLYFQVWGCEQVSTLWSMAFTGRIRTSRCCYCSSLVHFPLIVSCPLNYLRTPIK